MSNSGLPAIPNFETEKPMAETDNNVFDREEALENVGGMEDLLRELGETLIEEIPKLQASARAAVATGDSQAVSRVLHSIKGSVTPFAAKASYELAWQLEQSSASGDLSQADDLLSKLEIELSKLATALTEAV
jgi:HPt (histidine-containing phosphotransfer) domain-containing protein